MTRALSGVYVDYFNEKRMAWCATPCAASSTKAVKPHRRMGRGRCFPARDLPQAGGLGLLSIGHPTGFGGSGEQDVFLKVAASEELMRSGSGGFVASLGSLDIGLPPVWRTGSDALKARIVPQVLAGEDHRLAIPSPAAVRT